MSSAVILTWMEISFVFITVVFCFGSLVRKVSKSSGPGEQLLKLWSGVKVGAILDTLAGTEESLVGICVWNAMSFVCFCFVWFAWGAFKKRHLGVSLFICSLSQTCAEHARAAPTHNGLKCKWQFYTLCLFLFVFNVLFCSLYSLTFRLACSQHARNCVRTCSLSPGVLAVCFYYLFLFNVYFWKFLRIVCVLFFCSRGLNLSFLHRLIPSFLSFCWIQICFAYTEFFKNFTSSLIVYQLFLLFLLIGFLYY